MPSHPQLLADLAAQFAGSGFDVKHLIRAICNSQTYQRTSKPAAGSPDADPELFSRMAVKVFTPEQMFDSLVQVLALPTRGTSRADKERWRLASAISRRARFRPLLQGRRQRRPDRLSGRHPAGASLDELAAA